MKQLTKTQALVMAARVKKRPKYLNKKVVTPDGLKFDSRKEARRHAVLQLRVKAGEIRNLETQVKFEFWVGSMLVCSYYADFCYEEKSTNLNVSESGGSVIVGNRRERMFQESWAYVVEDVKSPRTRKEKSYRIKAKLLKALYGHEVREV